MYSALATRIVLATSAILLCPLNLARAQKADFNSLVAPLAKKITRTHERKIVVLPLLSNHPGNILLGIWLAKQISASLASAVPGLQPIDASKSSLPLQNGGANIFPTYDKTALRDFVKRVGADIVVSGQFGPYENGLSVSLAAAKKESEESFVTSEGRLALTPEIQALLSDSSEFVSPADRVYRAGLDGVSIPKCRHCPSPQFPKDKRKARGQGIVLLLVVVGVDGQTRDIQVVQSPGVDFSKAAIEAVKTWVLDPAVGPDGKPVAVRLPIEVSFRLRR
jgi:TonB family protein